jgi:putative transcriptional regulator
MMIAFHPEHEMLFDYASGSLEEEPSLIVAAHLAFCNLCREEVRSLESLGGALMSEPTYEQLAPDALDADTVGSGIARAGYALSGDWA